MPITEGTISPLRVAISVIHAAIHSCCHKRLTFLLIFFYAYDSKVTELVKSITLLDNLNVFRISFGVNLDNIPLGKVAHPVPIRGNYFGEPDTHATVLEFLTR